MLTSQHVLAMDITELADLVNETPFWYRLTKGERKALMWIGDRYGVAITLMNGFEEIGDGPEGAVYVDPYEIGYDLGTEGLDRLPCLDESTALARIIWAIGPI
jgi:hypothetical protein